MSDDLNARPLCPECLSLERVEEIPPPKHDHRARWICSACNLVFVGSPAERQRHQAAKLARQAERGDFAQVAHDATTVLHGTEADGAPA